MATYINIKIMCQSSSAPPHAQWLGIIWSSNVEYRMLLLASDRLICRSKTIQLRHKIVSTTTAADDPPHYDEPPLTLAIIGTDCPILLPEVTVSCLALLWVWNICCLVSQYVHSQHTQDFSPYYFFE